VLFQPSALFTYSYLTRPRNNDVLVDESVFRDDVTVVVLPFYTGRTLIMVEGMVDRL
jgi:hypothetical protein